MKPFIGKIIGWFLFLFGIALAIYVAIMLSSVFRMFFGDGRDELGSKHEWSVLEAVEETHRGKKIAEPTVIAYSSINTPESVNVLALPSRDGTRPVWVLLAPKYQPLVKAMPDKDFSLTQAQFDSVEKNIKSREVAVFLREHITR